MTPEIDDEDEYVYDVYYKSAVPLPNTDLNSGDVTTRLIATVSGLQALDGLSDDGSDDSIPDEADEDSNGEDYYKNDYPDSDDTGSVKGNLSLVTIGCSD